MFAVSHSLGVCQAMNWNEGKEERSAINRPQIFQALEVVANFIESFEKSVKRVMTLVASSTISNDLNIGVEKNYGVKSMNSNFLNPNLS